MSGKATYPANHQAGMRVPHGGSMCANCKYLGDDKKSCTEENFIKWNGSEAIPGKIDEYCSDWYMPASLSKPRLATFFKRDRE
jgi:hypothetical protein